MVELLSALQSTRIKYYRWFLVKLGVDYGCVSDHLLSENVVKDYSHELEGEYPIQRITR